MELNKRDLRAIMYYEFAKGSSASNCTNSMCEHLSEGIVSERTVQRWFKKWKNGVLTLDDEVHTGRPLEINLDQLKEIVDSNPSFTCLDLSLEFNLSEETIRLNLHKLGYVSKLNKWVPHLLNDNQKKSSY